ncbi:MAG: phosphatidylserine/phosphatidylglycerophosphate/cardiolipin synthase family protein [Polyangiaceae bacterium]|nr:phosphatidylserine/phosphatidylglycerophosphate/cardiolipin synthase family protein [Polyangiaceae bacterium]
MKVFSVDGDDVALLRDGAQAFPAMEAAIAGATREVLLEMYWVGDDVVGRRFRDALTQKARQGVRVRVVYDAVGSLTLRHTFWQPLIEASGEVFDYHSFSPFRPTFRLRNLEERDHRKLLVVDGRTAFTGGINLARPWLPIDEGGDGFRDDMISVEGFGAQELRTLFYKTWRKLGGVAPKDLIPVGRSRRRRVWVLSSLQKKRSLRQEYLVRIRTAQHNIDIANSYFVPDRAVRAALARAAARGVRVRILVPARGDVPIVQFALEGFFDRLLRHGIEVYTMTGPLMHAKTAIIDDHFVTIGSYNFDHRSFTKNLELNVAVEDVAFATHVRAFFEEDVRKSKQIVLAEWLRRSLVRRPVEWAALALRRLW